MMYIKFRTPVLLTIGMAFVLAACAEPGAGGATTTVLQVTSTTKPDPGVATTTPELRASCGAVELAGGLAPQLPSTPIDSEGEAALAAMEKVAAGEYAFFEQYEWFTTETSGERLVLFGAPIDETPEGAPPYAEATFQRDGDTWRPVGWGQCRVEVSSPGYGIAHWVLDPESDPGSSGTELHVLINERACASGEAPIGREILPVVLEEPDTITIVVLVEPVSGAAACPGNPWHAISIGLSEPVGDRRFFDASMAPQFERFWPPSQAVLGSAGSQP